MATILESLRSIAQTAVDLQNYENDLGKLKYTGEELARIDEELGAYLDMVLDDRGV